MARSSPDRRTKRPGPARARRAAALHGPSGIAISREAEEILFAHAELLTEARVDANGYSGSTMITIDLEAASGLVRGLDTVAERERFVTIAKGSVRLRLRAMRFACTEATRRVPERALGTFNVDTSMRLEGPRMLVDVDVDAAFAEAGREQRG